MSSKSFLQNAIHNEIFKKSADVLSNGKHQHVHSAQIKRSNTITIATNKINRSSSAVTDIKYISPDEKSKKKLFLEMNESGSNARIGSSSSMKSQKVSEKKKSSQDKSIKFTLERTTISRSSNNSNTSISTINSRQVTSAPSNSYTLENLINEIVSKKFKKILVLTGAGISTPSGIPDFRTPNTGIYDNLAKFNVPYPEAIFEKEYFRRNPKPFFKIAKDLLPNKKQYKPNKIHYFIRLLQEKRILHRLYTQNIDSLETLAGIKPEKLVEAHGSFRSAKCVKCTNAYPIDYVDDAIKDERIPICNICFGIVKPDIVFFGEDLPEQFYKMYKRDFALADLVIVLGTSLKVEPFASIIEECPKTVPRVLMNKHLVGPFKKRKNATSKKDVAILGDLIDLIDMFVQNIGWKEELNELMTRELDILAKKIQIEEELAEKARKQKETELLELNKKAETNKSTTKPADKPETKIEKPANTTLYNKLPLTLKSTSTDPSQLLSKRNNKSTPNLDTNPSSNRSEKDYFKNILEKYENIRKGANDYSLSYGVKKIDLNENYNLFSNYKSKIDLITHKPPPAKPTSVNNNKIVDIYVVKTATPIKFSDNYGGILESTNTEPIKPVTNLEKFNKYCSNTSYQPPPKNLFEEPVTKTNTLSTNLNNNNTFYMANSKPLIKHSHDLPVLQMAKLNVENLDIIEVERKNNELILQMRRNCKC